MIGRPPRSTLVPYTTRFLSFFFFNDTATTEISTLSLYDALPISWWCSRYSSAAANDCSATRKRADRKSTRLNSSHGSISYAVFCFKKKAIDDVARAAVLVSDLFRDLNAYETPM